MAATNRSLLNYTGGQMGIDLRTGRPTPMATRDSWQAAEVDRMARTASSMAGHNRLVNVGKFASAVPLAMATGGMGGGASGAGASAGGPTAAGRFSLGSLLKLAEVAVPAITGLFGMRSQNQAQDRASGLEQQNLQAQMQWVREQEAQRKSEADRLYSEEQRRWNVEQQNRAKELAALEEERAYARARSDYDFQQTRDRDARRQQARFRLEDFLGMRR